MSEQISGDELAAALYREQGYLVLGDVVRRKIGEVVFECDGHEAGPCRIPLIVKSESSRAEFEAQGQVARNMFGLCSRSKNSYSYFYFVEAAD